MKSLSIGDGAGAKRLLAPAEEARDPEPESPGTWVWSDGSCLQPRAGGVSGFPGPQPKLSSSQTLWHWNRVRRGAYVASDM